MAVSEEGIGQSWNRIFLHKVDLRLGAVGEAEILSWALSHMWVSNRAELLESCPVGLRVGWDPLLGGGSERTFNIFFFAE